MKKYKTTSILVAFDHEKCTHSWMSKYFYSRVQISHCDIPQVGVKSTVVYDKEVKKLLKL